jgi:uncharacterized protein involved in exopolysaccharide biosynthesis
MLIDLFRRAMRHAWLVALIVIVGAGLSVVPAPIKKPVYESETVLLYQEKISQSVLKGANVAARGNRTTSSRFKEMLLSRTALSAIVEEFNLYPDVVKSEGTIAAAEKLRLLIRFSDRGSGTYKISYRGTSPDKAQKITARLADQLQQKDETIRREQAQQTKIFLEGERASAENALREVEAEFATFVTKHPEFVAETAMPGGSAGAAIRAANEKSAKSSGDSKLSTLQRQARRLKQRIANPDAPVVSVVATERVESPAERQAKAELDAANRNLEDKSQRFTPKHPDVIAAKNKVAEAKRRLSRIVAAAKATANNQPRAATSPTASTADLKRELARIESEINRLQASKRAATTPLNDLATELVNLETEHARLQRRVDQAAARLSNLEARVFTAEITASSEFAEAAKLVIIDAAYLPARAAGRGRKIIAMAGTMLFVFLGCALALGLALIDDKVYRRADIDELGIAPVLIVIPKASRKQKKKKSRRG